MAHQKETEKSGRHGALFEAVAKLIGHNRNKANFSSTKINASIEKNCGNNKHGLTSSNSIWHTVILMSQVLKMDSKLYILLLR